MVEQHALNLQELQFFVVVQDTTKLMGEPPHARHLRLQVEVMSLEDYLYLNCHADS